MSLRNDSHSTFRGTKSQERETLMISIHELCFGNELGSHDVHIALPTGLTIFAHSSVLKVASGWFRMSMDPRWWSNGSNLSEHSAITYEYRCVKDKNADPDDEVLQWTLVKDVEEYEEEEKLQVTSVGAVPGLGDDDDEEEEEEEETEETIKERTKSYAKVERGFVALLAVIYDEPLGNVRSLQLIRTLVHLADEYDCLKRISSTMRGLLHGLPNLKDLIISIPDVLLWISLKVQDAFIFSESFVHCVGKYLFAQTWIPNLWNEHFSTSLQEEVEAERVRLMLLFHETQSTIFKVIDHKDYDEVMHDIVRNRVLDAFAKVHLGTRVPFERLSAANFMPTATEELAKRVDWSRAKYQNIVRDQTNTFKAAVNGLLLNNSKIDLERHGIKHLTCATCPKIPWKEGEFNGYRFNFSDE